jgi:hypothetical protein
MWEINCLTAETFSAAYKIRWMTTTLSGRLMR